MIDFTADIYPAGKMGTRVIYTAIGYLVVFLLVRVAGESPYLVSVK